MELVRLNKFLSEAGVCSRREADRLVEEGLITVDGKTAEIGMKISTDAHIEINGEPVTIEEEKVLLVFHKPAGVVCTAEKREKNNVIDYLQYPKRIFPVGRLDKDSTGLLLMTNDGDLVNKIMRAGNYHEKEYEVTVNHPVTSSFLKQMASGVAILDTVTRRCKVERMGEKQFRIILTQGLNRQIRRMCEALGYRVTALKRVRIMNIQLGDLQEGAYRDMTSEEEQELMRLLEDSSSLSVKERLVMETDTRESRVRKDTHRKPVRAGQTYSGKTEKNYQEKSGKRRNENVGTKRWEKTKKNRDEKSTGNRNSNAETNRWEKTKKNRDEKSTGNRKNNASANRLEKTGNSRQEKPEKKRYEKRDNDGRVKTKTVRGNNNYGKKTERNR